ncbi:5-taurinomethyluridine-[tRNA] synthase subunit GTPB3, mitochondrial [Sinocyclocheilus rhinocerous]|uniref:5-taurinomethyluridine-[tRNA] synthase subunit GTPB3, mitochondrial n=1 Tax=Sinocyclocheilus rhinocerous TaxID=307959 RepID=UPI0007B7DCB5|nr:PREDICTED: tRNA modification GTPase GTPBP3, mitochondrial [Sinocyclocheilus rhinocerous]
MHLVSVGVSDRHSKGDWFVFGRSLPGKRLLCSVRWEDDSVFALSSGQTQGRCGVAVVRVSGPASALAVRSLTRGLPAARTDSLRSITHPQTRGLLYLWFPVRSDGPGSFTGEDSAEFHIHGGPAVISGVLQALGSLPGLWPAEAGEFTRRAFYAGKLDLTEVEGLGDLIHAETEAQRRQALRQMAGDLGRIYQDWSVRLKRVMDAAVRQLQTDVENHLSDQRRGERLRSGVQVGIAGSTNAGKSSLLNISASCCYSVSHSRDHQRCRGGPVGYRGYPVLLSDTAGLRDTTDSVEQEGVRHARQRGHLKSILEHSSHRRECILILNKSDRISAEHKRSIQAALEEAGDVPPACFLSCHTRDGLEDLLCGDPLISSPSLTQSRHRTHLQKSVEALQQYYQYRDVDLVLAAEGLCLGLTSLGRITGKVGAEEILDIIFKDFCIGK